MNALMLFHYQAHQVRVFFSEDGEPIWIAKDVCDILGLSKHRDALGRLDADQRSRPVKVDTNRGPREMATVNESGLWELVLESKKPGAKAFRKWLTSEVLPQLRKTGYYAMSEHTATLPPSISSDTVTRLTQENANLRRENADLREIIDLQRTVLDVKEKQLAQAPKVRTCVKWTPQDIQQVVLLHERGVGNAEIGRRIGRSASAVAGVLYRRRQGR